jgi:putative sterol carrier protein
MNVQDLQKKGQQFYKRNKKAIGTVIHFVPAPPLIHLIFDGAFPRMVRKRHFKKFQGMKTDFQFTFSEMPGKKSWVIDIDDGKVRVYRGEKDLPHMVINASARDFIDLTSGYLPEAKAMMSGRLAVNGGPATKLKTVMELFG